MGEVPLERDGVPASGPRCADLREGAEASEIRQDGVDDDYAQVVIGADGATASHGVRSTPPLSDEIGVEPAALCQVHEWDVGDTREAASARDAELEAADDGLDHLLDAHR